MTDTTFPSGGVEAVDVPAVGAPSVVASRHRKPSSWIGRIFRSLCVSGATTILSLAILVVSTIVVAKAGHWADSIGASPEERTIIIVGAQILTYGMLWMGQFVMLD